MKRSLKFLAAGVAATAMVVAPTAASAQEDPSIAEIAVENGLDTLVTAVTLAGLDGALADCAYGPVTVFAPTEEAFAALPADVLNAAIADPEGLLTQVLLYHVVPGVQDAAAVTSATSLTTAQGQDLSVDGTVLNGSVNIVATDITACNGIVHVIDAVLIPELGEAETTEETNELPDTGVNSGILALVAGAFLLTGGAVLGLNRRRVEV